MTPFLSPARTTYISGPTKTSLTQATLIAIAVAALLSLLVAGCQRNSNYSEGVELALSTDEPTPNTTFELRFDSAMVRGDEVGVAVTNSPLTIAPPLAGTFTWLSPRSGVFTPTEPLAMDTTYRLRLRPGLRLLDGTPSNASLREAVTTPAFGLIGASPQYADTNATAEPEIQLVFNADVRADGAQRLLSFRDRSGRRVPADVRQGTFEEMMPGYRFAVAGTLRTWARQWEVHRAGGRVRYYFDSGDPTNEVPSLLIVTPRAPLPLGKEWKLVLASGIPAADRSLRSREEAEVPVGDVTPFVVRRAQGRHFIYSGPSIEFEFSKDIPELLTNDFRDRMEINPSPTNLSVRVAGRSLTLDGDFKGGAAYTVRLKPGFEAVEPFKLTGSNEFKVIVPHMAPRLYFPAFLKDQMANGNRSFPLLAINAPKVRIRAKLMDPQTAIHALRGYRSYFSTYDEPYQRVDYNLVPGRTVFDRVLRPGPDMDRQIQLDLHWDELLNGRKTGVVLLDAERATDDGDREPALGTQALIQLTDIGIALEKSKSGVDAFAFSHSTGDPIRGAVARLLSDENESLREAITDTNGLVHLDANTDAKWVAVQFGDDFHAMMLNENGEWFYRYHLAWSEPDPGEDARRVMLFTDRTLYRPGETAHLKALVRNWSDHGLAVPDGLRGLFRCVDARQKKFFETNAVFDSSAGWTIHLPLPTGSRGAYTASLQFGKQIYSHTFQVQDFQPDAFEITIPAKSSYSADEPIPLLVSARYFFGKPLSRARVKWSLDADDMGFRPQRFESFNFCRSDFEDRFNRSRSSATLHGEGMLIGATHFVIAPDLPVNPVAPQPRLVSLLVEVTDLNQQTLSRHVEFVRHSSDFYLGLRDGGEVLTASNALPLEVVAVRSDGQPWPETVHAMLKLQRLDWETVRIQGAGKTIRYRQNVVFTNILDQAIDVRPVQMPDVADEPAQGNRISDLPPLPAGEYLLEVQATDSGGRPVITSLQFAVSAPAEVGWPYRSDVRLALAPDQKLYAPGDTAHILVKSPFSGNAVVSVEREKVLRSFTTHLDGNASSISVPLLPDDVPNVYVSVTLVRGSADSPHKAREPEYRQGNCELSVIDPQSRLGVAVRSDSTNCLPGQPVELTVAVTDDGRKPVPNANVVLYAVDEGILSLSGYETPDPHGFFYAARALGVQSCISLPNLLSEDPEELRFENKGYQGGGGGRDRVRKNFQACAFWSAELRTDADGNACARFTAPDSLTRYRVFAVVYSGAGQFGNGTAAFEVAKPLMIESALPAIANVTDHLTARGLVHNQTSVPGDVIVTLELDGVARPSDNLQPANDSSDGRGRAVLTRRIHIPSGASVPVEFPVEFTDVGEAKWTWRAHFAETNNGDFADAVQSRIEVGHIAPILSEVLLSRVVTSGETNLLAYANPQLLAGRGAITVTMANTRVSELAETASQLLHYPYGCVEQTGSSLLPWILLRDSPELLGLLHHGTNDIQAAIHAGVARLFSMQTESGGLGYWPHAREPMLWASAYGGMVLGIARKHGVEIPGDEFESLLKYLSASLRSLNQNSPECSDACLALYALAVSGRAEPAYHERFYSLRGKLSSEDRALLALAIGESRGSEQMIAELLRPAHGPEWIDDSRFGCFARERAIRLLAWARYRPRDQRVDALVEDLMREQKQAHWGTTQGDAWALLALTEYARQIEGAVNPAAGELRWNGHTVPFSLNQRTNVLTQTFTYTNWSDRLVLLNQSTNTVFTTVRIEARPAETPQPRQDRGFSLQRRYDRLDDDDQVQAATDLHVGDRVLVTLRLVAHDSARYVVIDDALPAILEAVNPEFKTRESRSENTVGDGTGWISNFREIRKDRCLSFVDMLPQGTYTFRYIARVRAAGMVTAPSAKIEEMYHPERCGLSGSEILTSEDGR